MNCIKSLAKNLIVLAVAIVISLLFLEIAIRIIAPQVTYSAARQSSPPIYQKSDYLPWTLLPNANATHIGVYGDFNVSVRINSGGIRDYERKIQNDSIRILVMGDSMTYGFGVEMNQSYAKALENILNKRENNPRRREFQVFNTGFANGYSLDSYYLYLKSHAMKAYDPDIVIIGFFVYNDVTDLSLNVWEVDANALPTKITSPYYDVDSEHRLRSAKRTLKILKNDFVKSVYEGLLTRSHLFIFVKAQISKRLTISKSNRIFDTSYNEEIALDWEKNKKLLDAINQLVKERNAKLMVVALPVRFQIRDEEWVLYEKQIGANLLNRTRPNDELQVYAQQHNITFIDVYERFRREDQSSPLFLPIDGHFNKKGHQIVAEEIYGQAKQDFTKIASRQRK